MLFVLSRRLPGFVGLLLSVLAGCTGQGVVPPHTALEEQATVILGQPDADHGYPNTVDARGLLVPAAVAVDRSATPARLFVADTGNHRVLGYQSLDALRTGAPADLILGQPDAHSALYEPENHIPQRLHEPCGLAVDATGNLYVADREANRVLLYYTPFHADCTADVILETVVPQHADRPGSHLAAPGAVAIGPDGTLYVGDTENNRVLIYHNPLGGNTLPDGVLGQPDLLSVTPGVGPDRMSGPCGVAVDASGTVAVADTGNHRVLLFSGAKQSAAYLLGQDDFEQQRPGATPFRFRAPRCVAFSESGYLAVVDTGNHRLLIYRPGIGSRTQASWLLGQGRRLHSAVPNFGGLSSRSLHGPQGACFGPEGLLVVADTHNHRVLIYRTPLDERQQADIVLGQVAFDQATENLTDSMGYFFPQGVAVDRHASPNRLYVADTENHRVLAYVDVTQLAPGTPPDRILGQPDAFSATPNNPRLLDAPQDAASARTLFGPSGLGVDAHSNLYVADRENNRVLVFLDPFATDTTADRVFGQRGKFTTREPNCEGLAGRTLHRPEAVALDAQGNLYVADTRNHRVLRFEAPLTSDDVPDALWGQTSYRLAQENGGGPVSERGLSLPFGLAVADDGTLVIADTNNHRVLVCPPGLQSAARVLGQLGDLTTRRDNAGALGPHSLSGPQDVLFFPNGDLAVADTANSRILLYHDPFRTDLIADRVFGQQGSFERNDPSTGVEGLWFPCAVDRDSSGALYVADKGASRVVVYRAARN